MRGTPPPAALLRRLQSTFDRLASRRGVPHALVLVEHGTGGFRWASAAGESRPGGEPMRVDTPFFVASIDKTLTAAVVFLLHEDGRLGLDDPLEAWLDASRLAGLHRLAGVDRTHQLTIRHLLSHTSGLPDWLEDRPRGGRSLVEEVFEGGDQTVELDGLIARVRDRLTPHFPPQPLDRRRPRVRYSDTNFMLLTAVVEAATGQPLHLVHATRLFGPLGMRHTWVEGHSRPLEPTPTPAALWAGGAPLEIPRLMHSMRGIYATADDLLRFLRAMAGGGLFASTATFARMQQPWRRFGVPLDAAALRAPGWPIEYGLGLMRFALPRWLTPFAPVPAVIGHTGSTGCWLFHCPALDLWLAGTVDQATAGGVPFRLVPRVLRHVTRSLPALDG